MRDGVRVRLGGREERRIEERREDEEGKSE